MATMKLGTVPGVYIQEEVNPALAITEQRLKAAGLVGHAAPTLKLIDVSVVHTDAAPDPETGYVTDELVDRKGNAYLVQEVLSASDFRNAYGTNILKYTQLTAEEPVVAKPEGYPAEPVEPEEPIAPVEPEEPELPADPTPEQQAAHDAWEVAHAQWEDDYAQWELDHAQWVTDEAAWEVAHASWEAWKAYDAAVEDADYKVSGNKIIWLHPTIPSTEDNLSVPVADTTYYVSMIIKKTDDYYEPKAFTDYEDVVYTYGPEVYYVTETDPQTNEEKQVPVLSEVTKAAKLIFDNGADLLYICEVKPTDGSVFSETNVMAAVKKLTEYDIQTVICVPQSKHLHQLLMQQVVKDSSMEIAKERVAWISAAYDSNQKVTDDPEDVAQYVKGFGEQRIIDIVPATVTVSAEDEDGNVLTMDVSSIYAAAALTGITTNNAITVAEPLTRKTPAGILGLGKQYVRKDIEKMSAAGTTVLVLRNQAVSVNQAVTTDTSNQNNRELSVVLIKDEVMKAIRDNLDRQYIGHFYDRNRTPGQIKLSIQQMLDTMTGTLVQSYNQSDIEVTPDPYESTQINVKMAFAVLRPLNYIYISFMVTL